LEKGITPKDVCMSWQDINWGLIFYSLGIPIMTLLWNAGFKVFLSNRSFRHSREIFIIQKRFEKEVELTQKLWDLLIDNMTITSQLRPVVDFVEGGKTMEQVKIDRIRKWNDTYNEIRPVYLKSKPYISKELNEQVKEFLHLSYKECVSYKIKHKNEIEDFKEGEENIKNLSELLDEIKMEIGKVLDPKRKS
jgi:hypothetical protein